MNTDNPGLIVERLPIASLTLDPKNARKHPQANLDAIAGSLSQFGQATPILIDGNGQIVAGNGTVTAARQLGWTEIDAVRTALTGAKAKALALALNRTGELAEWDDTVLGETLHELRELDFDLTSIGFDTSSLDAPPKPDADGSREFGSEEFSEFQHKCPRCSFEFDTKPAS